MIQEDQYYITESTWSRLSSDGFSTTPIAPGTVVNVIRTESISSGTETVTYPVSQVNQVPCTYEQAQDYNITVANNLMQSTTISIDPIICTTKRLSFVEKALVQIVKDSISTGHTAFSIISSSERDLQITLSNNNLLCIVINA
jgi:hypothetical protein